MDAPDAARASNCVEEAALAFGVDADVGEVRAQNPQERERDAQRACQSRYSCLQPRNAEMKVCDGRVQAGC